MSLILIHNNKNIQYQPHIPPTDQPTPHTPHPTPPSTCPTPHKSMPIEANRSYDSITLWACTANENVTKIQWLQSQVTRIIRGTYDFTDHQRIDLVRSLKLYTILERRDYFLCLLILKTIHGLTPPILPILRSCCYEFWCKWLRLATQRKYLQFPKTELFNENLFYKWGISWKICHSMSQNPFLKRPKQMTKE